MEAGCFLVFRIPPVSYTHLDVYKRQAADCPTSVCQSYTLRKDGGIQQMFGTEFPFSSERLKAIYGDIGHYRTLVEKSVDNAVAHGWILADDREALIEASVETAKQRGLSCEI